MISKKWAIPSFLSFALRHCEAGKPASRAFLRVAYFIYIPYKGVDVAPPRRGASFTRRDPCLYRIPNESLLGVDGAKPLPRVQGERADTRQWRVMRRRASQPKRASLLATIEVAERAAPARVSKGAAPLWSLRQLGDDRAAEDQCRAGQCQRRDCFPQDGCRQNDRHHRV